MADNYINYLPFKTIYATNFITRTLFPFPCRTYFILVSLAKSYHFDTVLLLIYVVLKLVYPNCTHTVFVLFKSVSLNIACSNILLILLFTLNPQFQTLYFHAYRCQTLIILQCTTTAEIMFTGKQRLYVHVYTDMI